MTVVNRVGFLTSFGTRPTALSPNSGTRPAFFWSADRLSLSSGEGTRPHKVMAPLHGGRGRLVEKVIVPIVSEWQSLTPCMITETDRFVALPRYSRGNDFSSNPRRPTLAGYRELKPYRIARFRFLAGVIHMNIGSRRRKIRGQIASDEPKSPDPDQAVCYRNPGVGRNLRDR